MMVLKPMSSDGVHRLDFGIAAARTDIGRVRHGFQ